MKNLLAIVVGILVVFCASAQENQEELMPGPRITFEDLSFDFGDIFQGDQVHHTFTFENSGDQPLIITNVQTTCGCTATNWPRDPIPPGEAASLKVSFNSAGKQGRQNKIISVISNSVSAVNQVKITTNVLPKKSDSGE